MDPLERVARGRDGLESDECVTDPRLRRAVDDRTEALGTLGVSRPGQMIEQCRMCGEQHRHGNDATVRTMSSEVRRRAARSGPPPVVLDGDSCTARVRTWPFRPDTAHLVVLTRTPPRHDELVRWIDAVAALGYTRVRTSAIGSTMRHDAEEVGFVEIQELVLLRHDAPGTARRPAVSSRRLTPRRHADASVVDVESFGDGWSLDGEAIADVCSATPHHRARWCGDDHVAAYAITGRDRRQGFLQRLAVDPAHQRRGLGRSLVDDALGWLALWRVEQVFVNTPVDNVAALELYERAGFHRLADRLHVLERTIG